MSLYELLLFLQMSAAIVWSGAATLATTWACWSGCR